MRFTYSLTSLVLPLAAHAVYVWPSPMDEVDDLLYLHQGYIRRGLIDAVSPCSFSLTTGRAQQESANWVRTAFHDAITYNTSTGKGGLDASIVFETERAENPGEGFLSTLSFLEAFHNIKASMADLIALGAIVAIESCGGPVLPFRGGRTDANEGGPLGVPEPTESLDVLTTRFKNAGFNVQDMISMVACGHTLGGVHGKDFPDITGDSSPSSRVTFEKSTNQFDNAVVTEYLDGTTLNPLVVTKNDTFNSDKRVFAADGNTTMKGMASPQSFKDTCKSILTRMIDTVPTSVTLSEVLTPIEVKPDSVLLQLNSNKTLDFTGKVRVRTTNRTASALSVTLTYKPRTGEACPTCVITTTHPNFKGGQSFSFTEEFTWYEWSTTLPPSTSISSFDVVVTTTTAASTTSETFTNNGLGFPVQDAILYQPSQSCQYEASTLPDKPFNLTVVAAVRKDQVAAGARFDWVAKIDRKSPNITVAGLEIVPIEMKKWEATDAGEFYTLFKGERLMEPFQWSSSFDLVLGEDLDRVSFVRTSAMGSNCANL